jgi:hypothetical protein
MIIRLRPIVYVCCKLQFCKNNVTLVLLVFIRIDTNAPSQFSWQVFLAVLGIPDILVRIRIRRSVPLTNGSGSGSNSGFGSFPQAHYLQFKKFSFLKKFCVKILFCKHYFSPLNTFMRKGRIRIVPLTNGSGRPKNIRIRIPNTGLSDFFIKCS